MTKSIEDYFKNSYKVGEPEQVNVTFSGDDLRFLHAIIDLHPDRREFPSTASIIREVVRGYVDAVRELNEISQQNQLNRAQSNQ